MEGTYQLSAGQEQGIIEQLSMFLVALLLPGRMSADRVEGDDADWIQQHLVTEESTSEYIGDEVTPGIEEIGWIEKHRVLPVATAKQLRIDSKPSKPLMSISKAGRYPITISRNPALDRSLWMLRHLVTTPFKPLIDIGSNMKPAIVSPTRWKATQNRMALSSTKLKEKIKLEISAREPPKLKSARKEFITTSQTQLSNDKLANKYRSIDKQLVIITQATAAPPTKLSPLTVRHPQTYEPQTNEKGVAVSYTRTAANTVTVRNYKVIEESINNMYSETSQDEQSFDFSDDYGDSYQSEDMSHLSDIYSIEPLVQFKQKLKNTKEKLHATGVFGKQKINSANRNDGTLESELEDISDEILINKVQIADLEAKFGQTKHENKHDASKNVAIKKEISQLSNNLQHLEAQVEAIAGSGKNSVGKEKQTADRTEQVAAAELNKIEKTLQTNSKQIQQLQQEIINNAHRPNKNNDLDNSKHEEFQINRKLEGREKVFGSGNEDIEKVASDVEKGLTSLTKHIDTMEASQRASQEKLLGVLSELANGVINNKKEQSHLSNDKRINKYKSIDKQILTITRAPAASTVRHPQPYKARVTILNTTTAVNSNRTSFRHLQSTTLNSDIRPAQNASVESTTGRRPHVKVKGHKVIEENENSIYSEWEDETDKVDYHVPDGEKEMNEALTELFNEQTSHDEQLFDYSDGYGDSYQSEDMPHLSDINIIKQLMQFKHKLKDGKGRHHTADVFGKQKIDFANEDDVTLETEMGDISNEISANEGQIADLEAKVEQTKHGQKHDTSRDVAINKEIGQLSDNLQQLGFQVEAIAGSERNSASNMKQSADRTEQVVAAELNKIEKTLQTNSKQIQQLQQEIINNAHTLDKNHDLDDLKQENSRLDKNLEGHEKAVDNDIEDIEKVASDVEKGLTSLTKHMDTMEASQRASQQRLLGVLSELANGVVNNKKEQAKTMEVLANAQAGLRKKIEDSKKREHKPLMLVIPEQVTNSPSDIIKLNDAKHIIANIDREAKSLLTKEESLVGEALKQDEELRSLRQQTDDTAKSLLKDSQLLDSQSADEQRHLAKESKDKKIIQELISDKKRGWSDWSSWSNCFGFGCKSVGKSQRYRVCESVRGQCGGDTWQRKSCRRNCEPTQLASGNEWSAWSSWSECSRSCGDGTAGRERVCSSDFCEGSADESRPCSRRPCLAYPLAATYAVGHVPTAALNVMNHHGAVAFAEEQHGLDRGVMITCGHNPCLNGGICMGGGENEHVSHFMHFHCKCVHPYSGILCDSMCRASNEANGVAIGVLAGVLAMVLLAVTIYACLTFRQRVESWRRGYDPYSRRGRCWERLFGSRYSSAGSSYYTGSTTFSKCSAVTSSCGGLSVDEHMHDPTELNLSRDKRSRNPLANSEYTLEGTLSRSGNRHRRVSSSTKSATQLKTTTSETGSSGSESETEDDSSEGSLEYDTSTNENDNAKDHTLTQQSLAKNITNNQSALPNLASTNSKRKQKKKGKTAGEIASSKQIAHLNKNYQNGHCLTEPTTGKVRKKRKKGDNFNKYEQANDEAAMSHKPDVGVDCEKKQRDDTEKNLPELTDLHDKVDMVPTSRFRDPQLAERMHAIRQLIPKSSEQSDKGDTLAKYPLVQDFMSKWQIKPSGVTSKESRSPIKESEREELLPTNANTWTAVAGNPVHSVWSQMASPQQQPLMYEPTLSHSLASAVQSVRSFNSNADRSPVKEFRIHGDEMV